MRDADRFYAALAQVGRKRVTYSDLTGKGLARALRVDTELILIARNAGRRGPGLICSGLFFYGESL